MSSEAYRRSTLYPDSAELAKKDPLGTSYAVFKPRRLTAEELHDWMLSALGEINLAIGGIPVRPEINLDAALQPRMVMGTFAAAWQPSPLPHAPIDGRSYRRFDFVACVIRRWRCSISRILICHASIAMPRA